MLAERAMAARLAPVAPAAAPIAAAPRVQRVKLGFKPTLPAVSKKRPAPPRPAGPHKIVLKVRIKSPALKRRLGMAA